MARMTLVTALLLSACLASLTHSQQPKDGVVQKEEELEKLIHDLADDVAGLKKNIDTVLKDKATDKDAKQEKAVKDTKQEIVDKDGKLVKAVKDAKQEIVDKDGKPVKAVKDAKQKQDDEKDIGTPADELARVSDHGVHGAEEIANINLKANTAAAAKRLGDTLEGGDELLTPEQEKNWKYDEEHKGAARDAIRNIRLLWPKTGNRVRVPVFFTPAIADNAFKMRGIQQAIAEYSELTCIDFVPSTTRPTEHYIEFINDDGCFSLLGKANTGNGKQPISIGDGCGSKGVVEHEFMHALGFFHEQSRPDRDTYIKLQLDNLVSPQLERQFRMVPETVLNEGTFNIPYDIGSLMHYGSTAFAKPGTFTIVRRSDNQPFRSNRAGFAQSDLQALNVLYRCARAPPVTPKPPPPATPAPPAPTPEPVAKNRCLGFAEMGMCDYRQICAMCNEVCAQTQGVKELIRDKSTPRKCSYWLKTGYCNPEKEGHYAMSVLCAKTCFRAKYPADATCQSSGGGKTRTGK